MADRANADKLAARALPPLLAPELTESHGGGVLLARGLGNDSMGEFVGGFNFGQFLFAWARRHEAKLNHSERKCERNFKMIHYRAASRLDLSGTIVLVCAFKVSHEAT
jgi:hypothetical protein